MDTKIDKEVIHLLEGTRRVGEMSNVYRSNHPSYKKKIKYPRIQQNILTHNCIKIEYSSKPKYLVKAFMS